MTTRFPITLLGLLILPTHAQTLLNSGHVDIGVAYEAKAWNLHVHDESTDTEYAPADAVLQLGLNTLSRVPSSPSYAFLGAAGSPVYVLSQVQKPDQIFLGLGTEELDPADWSSPIQLRLKGVAGPGSLAVWDTDTFGAPVPLLNSSAVTGNGIDASDALNLTPGGHRHLNWGFTQNGHYEVTFEASGIHVLDGNLRSEDVTYHFSVVPEPEPIALLTAGLVLGLGWYAAQRQRRRHASSLSQAR